MATGQPRDLLRQLRRAALSRDGGGMTDGQLLESFVARRDEAAFEALVRRHGPMVLGVCRRVLGHAQDAEDAFQATFLVLLRKAASLRQRELLGNWLYGVAYRTALDARAVAARRRALERQVSPMPEPEAADAADVWRELRPLLDRELSRLPDKYRVPVVLCYLEGRTRRDVARQLGLPAGTLSGRLTTARRMLAGRLARHGGLALSGGALAAALCQGAATACVPAPLVAKVVAVAAGQAVGAAPAQAVALAEGVLKAMRLTKLKIATGVLLAAAVVVGAAAVALLSGRDAQGPGAPKVLKLGGNGRRVAWSPDGTTLAVAEIYEPLIYGKKGSAIKVWDVETGQVRQTLAESAGGGLAFQHVAFSADGKAIAATASVDVILPNMREIRDVIKVWDAKTLAFQRTLEGDGQLVRVALSADGKWVAAVNPGKKTLNLWNAATGALERTVKTGAAQPWSVAFSPDSKALMVGGQNGDGSGEVTRWDAETGQLKRTLRLANCMATAVAFSPDGRMVAAGGGGELVQVWDAETGEVLASLKGSKGGHRAVAFSPDSQTVAAGGQDGTVRLWDVPTGALKETLKGHGAEVYAVAFSPDGQTLASVSQDQTARLWPVNRPGAGPE
jgi:RNA polymerase sigma factor (sigma-70 family)